MNSLSPNNLQQSRRGFVDHRGQANIFGVIGYDQPVQWPQQPRPEACTGNNNFPFGKPVGLIRPQAVAE